jgi:MFS superfamily sulfate permease-like transporter
MHERRSAINHATAGRTQLVGIVAAAAMPVFLLFFTNALALLPKTALAVQLMAWGLIDLGLIPAKVV